MVKNAESLFFFNFYTRNNEFIGKCIDEISLLHHVVYNDTKLDIYFSLRRVKLFEIRR